VTTVTPLTTEQQAVVDHSKSNLFVCACPGSGKTRTVVDRFLARSSMLSSRRGIAVLSFSRRATTEIRLRCAQEGMQRLLSFPNYVGTLDGFFASLIFKSANQANTATPTRILDSWTAIGARVKIAGIRHQGVSLDAFPLRDRRPQFNPELLHGPEVAARKEVEGNVSLWESRAANYLAALNKKGYFTCSNIRTELRTILRSSAIGSALIACLSARFAEIIVDEAQDCDEHQLDVLGALAEAGVRLVVVADPEQAIYEFRDARPDLLAKFTEKMTRLELTGNWRSTPGICGVANSMRGSRYQPMKAIGKRANDEAPVIVIPYRGAAATAAHDVMIRATRAAGLEAGGLLILAHSTNLALKSAGLEDLNDTGGGGGVAIVRAAHSIMTGAVSGREAEKRLSGVAEILLRRLSVDCESSAIRDACIEQDISWRWLRGAAFGVVESVFRTLNGREVITLNVAVMAAREGLASIRPPEGRPWVSSPKQLIPLASAKATSEIRLRRGPTSGYSSTTASSIHAVKGGERSTVLVILPPKSDRIGPLLESWEQRDDNEGKRVAYVAMTRAERLLGIAVPEGASARLQKILEINGVVHRVEPGGSK